MRRFTLIHDGSDQGWQATYLAFHIAVQLGAPLLVLLVDSTADKNMLAQRATQVEVGARAAGVSIETRSMLDFSLDTLAEIANTSDGLFVSKHFVPDRKTALRFLESLTCPLWIVSQNPETQEMAVLVDDLTANSELVNYTKSLSIRIKQTLTGLVRAGELATTPTADSSITWMPLPDFSPGKVKAILNRVDISLLFIPVSRVSLVDEISVNCVIFPTSSGA